MFNFRYTIIGYLLALLMYFILLFFGLGLIGGIISFFIACAISSYWGNLNTKDGAIQGLIIGCLGWIIIFIAIMVVFSVPNFNSFIGDYKLITHSKNIAIELLLSVSYIIISILGGITGTKIKR